MAYRPDARGVEKARSYPRLGRHGATCSVKLNLEVWSEIYEGEAAGNGQGPPVSRKPKYIRCRCEARIPTSASARSMAGRVIGFGLLLRVPDADSLPIPKWLPLLNQL